MEKEGKQGTEYRRVPISRLVGVRPQTGNAFEVQRNEALVSEVWREAIC